MPRTIDSKQLDLLLKGCDGVFTADELKERLAAGKRLRVKLGMDPTAPDLTLGHTVVLRKLRQFQDLGHKAVLIIGDYTATVGDPTGRSKTRPLLTQEEIDANARTYLDQAGKVLDMSQDKLEVRRNSEWLTSGISWSFQGWRLVSSVADEARYSWAMPNVALTCARSSASERASPAKLVAALAERAHNYGDG